MTMSNPDTRVVVEDSIEEKRKVVEDSKEEKIEGIEEETEVKEVVFKEELTEIPNKFVEHVSKEAATEAEEKEVDSEMNECFFNV